MYTRGGDKGETGLFGARRVSKDSPRVEAYGSIDELNSCIGLAVSISRFKELTESLKKIQRLLFVAGADLATDVDVSGGRVPRIGKSDIERLEREIDSMQPKLPKLTKFILPGGSQLSAQ
ncbi:MAG: cob(I)yrinic acid a,c-diamide adenosyltransferase, partial [Thaumarchaeota archaeon]|nr:cob(I)yrinic acid a,c-diamide adenosyltransferase [Nitrososphaerota archaeon]